ncbi:helicase RepA family protein [bacterium]|nr:helicase RepA family protein [bacterium]
MLDKKSSTPMPKPLVLLAHGSFETLIDEPDQQYKGITLADIAKMVSDPQTKEKTDAAFIIPSSYRAHDGRKHSAQREHGKFWMLAIDVDEGNPSIENLQDAVRGIAGRVAALFYTSSGATAENRKYRVLIPLAEPLTGAEYVDAQLALFDLMKTEHNITCDTALSRTGQPIFLPNVPASKRDAEDQPIFFQSHKERGKGLLNVRESRIWENVEFRAKQAEMAEARASQERAARQAKREEQRNQHGDDVDPIGEFNHRNSIADLLLKYGYEQLGRSENYRSPQQTSGSFATKNFGEHWVSLSGSDVGAGIGAVKGDYCYGDAFDLFCHFEHNGDMKAAVREYAKELRPSNDYTGQRDQIVRDAMAAKADPLDGFDIIPDTVPQQGGIIVPKAPQAPIFWEQDAKPVLSASYMVKGWLGRSQMSVVYGPSNVGKSFFCLDVAFCIAANIEWQRSKVRGGPVLYLATEGGNAFRNRVVALRDEYSKSGVPLAVRPSPIDLLRPEADLAKLIELCSSIEADVGAPLSMIVVDTLSRAMAGGDENGPTDMTAFIANLDAIRNATGAHIMIVHHSGKDTAKGARGHSSLRAATDTEIELEVDGKIRTATATKQRDLEPQEPIVFQLKVHELGRDEDGDAVTTCTIIEASEEDKADANQKRPKGANQRVIANAFKQLRGEGVGASNPAGAGWPEAGKFWCIPENRLREFATGKFSATNPSSSYGNAMKALLAMGYMAQNEGMVWITAKEGRAT